MSFRDLFGGAIKAILPANLVDASDFRQVPDTQEVLLFPNSDVSLIVEILEKVAPSDSKDAAKFHFDSIAHDNDAESQTVEGTTVMPNDRGDDTPSPIVLTGLQKVKKFNHTTPDDVRIILALYRVETKNVDLVMSINIPLRTSEGQAVSDKDQLDAKQVFDTAARSLQIVDFGLFV